MCLQKHEWHPIEVDSVEINEVYDPVLKTNTSTFLIFWDYYHTGDILIDHDPHVVAYQYYSKGDLLNLGLVRGKYHIIVKRRNKEFYIITNRLFTTKTYFDREVRDRKSLPHSKRRNPFRDTQNYYLETD